MNHEASSIAHILKQVKPGIWIFKGFLDEKTREKISIVGSGFLTKVLEIVEKSNYEINLVVFVFLSNY